MIYSYEIKPLDYFYSDSALTQVKVFGNNYNVILIIDIFQE